MTFGASVSILDVERPIFGNEVSSRSRARLFRIQLMRVVARRLSVSFFNLRPSSFITARSLHTAMDESDGIERRERIKSHPPL